mmetsp:Transcript_64940/g.95089  ORF Transcript_64940/g.95089 Transcript_64940/m.95089 type:complete len:143 (+) Transcript_64940:705-1133(+)
MFERERILTEVREAEKTMKSKITAEAEARIYRQRNKIQQKLKEKLDIAKGEEVKAKKKEQEAAKKIEQVQALQVQERNIQKAQEEEIKKQLTQGMLVPLDTTPTRTIKKQTAKIESPMPSPPTLSKSDSLPPSPSLSPSLPK